MRLSLRDKRELSKYDMATLKAIHYKEFLTDLGLDYKKVTHAHMIKLTNDLDNVVYFSNFGYIFVER